MNEAKYKQHLIIWIIATVILVGIAFYAGDAYGTKHASQNAAALRGQFGGGANRPLGSRFGTGGGLVTGSVLSKDDTSMTVKSRDGSSKIILYSGNTQILKTAPTTSTNVSVGAQISVQGTQNSDGSITAQSIQIRPDMPTSTKSTQ